MSDVPVSVLILGRQKLMAQAVGALLDVEHGISVTAVRSSLLEALDVLNTAQVDLVVVDPAERSPDALELVAALGAHRPRVPVLVLGSPPARPADGIAGASEVRAFVAKDDDASALFDAVRTSVGAVMAGVGYPGGATAAAPGPSVRDGLVRLSPREVQILQFVADGHRPLAIAQLLGLSPHTVRNHLRRAMKRLAVTRQLDAVVAAAQAGLVRLAEGTVPQR